MKHLFWTLATIGLLIYAWVVWSWWDEGNQQRADAMRCPSFMDYSIDRIQDIPEPCLREWIIQNEELLK